MTTARCPNCGVTPTSREIADGWCDACGKKLPLGMAVASTPAGDAPGSPRAYLVAWVAGAVVLGLLAAITQVWTHADPAYSLGRLSFWAFGPSVVTVLASRGKGWGARKFGGVYLLALLGLGVLAVLSAIGRGLPN